MDRLELRPSRAVAGGDALARDPEGRVVFVAGAIPDEVVVAEVVEERNDFRRAVVVDVVEPSADRVAPPCPNVARGCGGCGWQHVTPERQRALKEDIVRDALLRIAKLNSDAMPTITTVALATEAFRTTVRVAIEDGRPRFHRAASAGLVDATGCLVAHPLVREVIDDGYFGDADDAVIRVGVASGERAILLRPTASGARLAADVVVVDAADRSAGAPRGVVHEQVHDRTLEVSIRSFFQSSPVAAAALVDEVLRSLHDAPPVGSFADLYAGVGLFAGAVGAATGAMGMAVERSPSAVADARRNLSDLEVAVVRSDVARWRSHRVDAVIADPARPGLGRPGSGVVVETAANTVVLVSCDAASFARDVGLLRAAGFALRTVALVDAFAHTPHIEVVSSFRLRQDSH